jgi:hypothetical protein
MPDMALWVGPDCTYACATELGILRAGSPTFFDVVYACRMGRAG